MVVFRTSVHPLLPLHRVLEVGPRFLGVLHRLLGVLRRVLGALHRFACIALYYMRVHSGCLVSHFECGSSWGPPGIRSLGGDYWGAAGYWGVLGGTGGASCPGDIDSVVGNQNSWVAGDTWHLVLGVLGALMILRAAGSTGRGSVGASACGARAGLTLAPFPVPGPVWPKPVERLQVPPVTPCPLVLRGLDRFFWPPSALAGLLMLRCFDVQPASIAEHLKSSKKSFFFGGAGLFQTRSACATVMTGKLTPGLRSPPHSHPSPGLSTFCSPGTHGGGS